jgi:hypothetical protein
MLLTHTLTIQFQEAFITGQRHIRNQLYYPRMLQKFLWVYVYLTL